MTTYATIESTCAVCGTASSQQIAASSNRFGSPDLDFRPPPMLRFTIAAWVQRCPECGYCAQSLNEAPAQAAEHVRGEGYQALLGRDDLPPAALKHLCASSVCEATDDLAEAGRAALRAAWCCDDDKAADAAKLAIALREQALTLLQRARARGDAITPQPGVTEALLADVARRAGRDEEARALVAEVREASAEAVLQQVADLQERLIDAGDRDAHLLNEATG